MAKLNEKRQIFRRDFSKFNTEEEVEKVVVDNFKLLFGDYFIMLAKSKILTSGGKGTIPDGIIVDFKENRWFKIEKQKEFLNLLESDLKLPRECPEFAFRLPREKAINKREILPQVAKKLSLCVFIFKMQKTLHRMERLQELLLHLQTR